jgi:hypothetical protein
MSRAANRKQLREECHDAVSCSYVETPDVAWLVDDIFDIVTTAIRRRFGLGIQETELILRDARNEAENLYGKSDLDSFVNLDQAIKAIAEYLTEDEESEKREEAGT